MRIQRFLLKKFKKGPSLFDFKSGRIYQLDSSRRSDTDMPRASTRSIKSQKKIGKGRVCELFAY